MFKIILKTGQKHLTCIAFTLQWNPINLVSNRPQKSAHSNWVDVFKGFYKNYKRMTALVQARMKWK